MLSDLIREKNLSMYKLSKAADVPYSTINDICSGRSRMEKCSAETVYRIAQALNMPMENLLAPYMLKRSSFENYKSTVCHRVKEIGDVDFIIEVLESKNIRLYFERHWYRESLYLLAMLDYLSRLNNIPLCSDYDDLRGCKLEKPVYPASLLALSAISDDKVLEAAKKTAIPEFMRFNIVENEVRDVV